MAFSEFSMLWATNGTGDGGAGGYTQSDWFDLLKRLLISDNEASQGVLVGYKNELAVTAGSGNVQVDTGAAMVDGIPYRNDGAGTVSIPTPGAGNSRIDRIVLRASWSAQTVRITRIAGTASGSPTAPALTQTANTTWDTPLAQVHITDGGVITVTDERVYCHFASRVATENLADDAVTQPKIGASAVGTTELADDAVTQPKIGASAVGTTELADDAVTQPKIGASAVGTTELADDAVTQPKIGASAVGTTELADDSIDDMKVGNRVPQLYRRQGGSANDWSTNGGTTYTPGAVRMQVGSAVIGSEQDLTITFPVAFSHVPVVFITGVQSGWRADVQVISVGSTSFTIHEYAGWSVVYWLAIGPE